MRVFEMRDMTPVEAFVLAPDYDRAFELFELHLQAHGGNPDTLLWREWTIEALGDAEQAAVREALGLRREGMLTCDTVGRWAFVTPLGENRETRSPV